MTGFEFIYVFLNNYNNSNLNVFIDQMILSIFTWFWSTKMV